MRDPWRPRETIGDQQRPLETKGTTRLWGEAWEGVMATCVPCTTCTSVAVCDYFIWKV